MNGKVAKMLRKTGKANTKVPHSMKRYWNSLSKEDRGQLRSDYNKMKNIQTAGTTKI